MPRGGNSQICGTPAAGATSEITGTGGAGGALLRGGVVSRRKSLRPNGLCGSRGDSRISPSSCGILPRGRKKSRRFWPCTRGGRTLCEASQAEGGTPFLRGNGNRGTAVFPINGAICPAISARCPLGPDGRRPFASIQDIQRRRFHALQFVPAVALRSEPPVAWPAGSTGGRVGRGDRVIAHDDRRSAGR